LRPDVQTEETAASPQDVPEKALGFAPAAEIDDRDDDEADSTEETWIQWVTELGEYVQLLNELHRLSSHGQESPYMSTSQVRQLMMLSMIAHLYSTLIWSEANSKEHRIPWSTLWAISILNGS
jgi:hypothetical protein